MRPRPIWFVCAGIVVFAGALFVGSVRFFGINVWCFIGELMLVTATAVAIKMLRLLDEENGPVAIVGILMTTSAVLFVGVACKWNVVTYALPQDEIRAFTPIQRIACDAVMMTIVTLFWMLTQVFTQHIEPFLFVRPGDRSPLPPKDRYAD